jgi:hypothetical protein
MGRAVNIDFMINLRLALSLCSSRASRIHSGRIDYAWPLMSVPDDQRNCVPKKSLQGKRKTSKVSQDRVPPLKAPTEGYNDR